MAFYEYNRSSPTFLKTEMSKLESVNFHFPLHFHSSFELLFVYEGEIEVTVDGVSYSPHAGELMLIAPDLAHSYRTKEYSKIGILIFNAGLLPEVCEETQAGVYRNPLIPDGTAYFARLKEVEGNLLLFRAELYRIAAAYTDNPPLRTTLRCGGSFVPVLSAYLEAHCTEEISEASVAKEMGYHPRYLSSLINKNFGVSFSRLLNEYRIKLACKRIRAREGNITEIYLAAGFESQSSFNRNFKAIMG